ncbi:MAG: hypothetical protein PHE15_05935 [Dehalococcoidales bacterium]|nr:hypothetical protein [Dehalococcoidales bacterium]
MLMNFLQIVFGLAAIFFSWTLADLKIPGNVFEETFNAGDGDLVIGFIPPSTGIQIILLACGLVILGCGIWQWKKRIRYARIQVFSGSVITVISAFLGIRSWIIIVTSRPWGDMDISNLFYLSYAVLACGALVIVITFIQFMENWNKKSRFST